MTKNDFSSSSGKKEFLLIAGLAISLIIALAFLILTIVSNFEKHVDTVKNTKVPYEESLAWRPDARLCEKGILEDLEKNPNKREAKYNQLELSEKALQTIGRMKKLTRLSLRDSVVKSDWLKHITGLPLTFLGLNGTRVTDSAIPYIMKLNRLQFLDLGDTEITDNGLKVIALHPTIKILELDRTNISDTGIKYLESRKNLIQLDVSSTKVTKKCIDSIIKFKKLERLEISGIPMDADSIKKLSGLKRLRILTLENNAVSDKDLIAISSLKSLKLLNLSRTEITDKSLEYIEKLPQLKLLELTSCRKVSKNAIENLRRKHPKWLIKFTNTTNDLPKNFPIDVTGGELEENGTNRHSEN